MEEVHNTYTKTSFSGDGVSYGCLRGTAKAKRPVVHPQPTQAGIRSNGRIILTGTNRSTSGKARPSAAVPRFCCVNLASNRLSYGRAQNTAC